MSSVSLKVKDLEVSSLNCRTIIDEKYIDQLAANIAAVGVLNNLVVTQEKGKYAVIAGGNRLRALKKLIKAGTFAADYSVECEVRNTINPQEISLSENVIRSAMHPVEEFQAFAKLIDEGAKPHDVALRFGVQESHVQQRINNWVPEGFAFSAEKTVNTKAVNTAKSKKKAA